MSERDLELLSAYLDDALLADERAALDARLQTDAELRRQLALLGETRALIAGLPQLRAPRPLTLTAAHARRPVPLLLSPWLSAASAAAALLLFVAGLLSMNAAISPMTSAPLVASAPTAVLIVTDSADTLMSAQRADVTATLPLMGTMPPPAPGVSEVARAEEYAITMDETGAADAAAMSGAAIESAPADGSAAAMLAQQPLTTPDAMPMAAAPASTATLAAGALELAIQPDTLAASAIPFPSPTAVLEAVIQPTIVGDLAEPAETRGQPFTNPPATLLIVLGMVALFVALVTTLLRMRR
jgi:hypothetical protein